MVSENHGVCGFSTYARCCQCKPPPLMEWFLHLVSGLSIPQLVEACPQVPTHTSFSLFLLQQWGYSIHPMSVNAAFVSLWMPAAHNAWTNQGHWLFSPELQLRRRQDRDRPVHRHSILKKYHVRRLSCWLGGQGEILRLSKGWLVCRSQNEYVVLPDTSSWQSQNFFMESKIVKLLRIGWRFWFLEDRFLLLLDWLWLTQYLQCAESP